MPIRKTERLRYPTNWRAISHRIRFQRAQGRCECIGQCGIEHGLDFHGGWVSGEARCRREHGSRAAVNGGRVVLTVAHLDHTPENVSEENLLAMCQACHLRYDRDLHAQTRAKR